MKTSTSPDEPRLVLVPVDLCPGPCADWTGTQLRSELQHLRRFVVEHPKTARHFLKRLGLPVQGLELEILDEHSRPQDVERLAAWLAGGDTGLLSEAGCPAIADPGATLVSKAHGLGIRVVPLVGPCSLVLALMASGLDGQRFAFSGYLPQEAAARDAAIRELETRSRRYGQTEIFIEAPYRNDTLFAALLAGCDAGTRLAVACDLTAPTELIATRTIGEWHRVPAPVLHKRPTVFLLQARVPEPSAQRRRRAAGA